MKKQILFMLMLAGVASAGQSPLCTLWWQADGCAFTLPGTLCTKEDIAKNRAKVADLYLADKSDCEYLRERLSKRGKYICECKPPPKPMTDYEKAKFDRDLDKWMVEHGYDTQEVARQKMQESMKRAGYPVPNN